VVKLGLTLGQPAPPYHELVTALELQRLARPRRKRRLLLGQHAVALIVEARGVYEIGGGAAEADRGRHVGGVASRVIS